MTGKSFPLGIDSFIQPGQVSVTDMRIQGDGRAYMPYNMHLDSVDNGPDLKG